MASETGGVWRTVGGRRIFIKDGQDLASAMKESGKFKTKKQEEKGKKFNDTMDKRQAIIEKLDKETADLEEYDKYNLAVSKLENNDYSSPTERQYWAGTIERYKKSQEMPEEAKFSKLLEESGVKTFADEIKEQSSKIKILSEKQLSNMSWEEVVQENTKYYSAKSIYDFEGGKQGKYKYEDGWRDNGGAGVIKQSDIDKLITREEWLKAKKKK